MTEQAADKGSPESAETVVVGEQPAVAATKAVAQPEQATEAEPAPVEQPSELEALRAEAAELTDLLAAKSGEINGLRVSMRAQRDHIKSLRDLIDKERADNEASIQRIRANADTRKAKYIGVAAAIAATVAPTIGPIKFYRTVKATATVHHLELDSEVLTAVLQDAYAISVKTAFESVEDGGTQTEILSILTGLFGKGAPFQL